MLLFVVDRERHQAHRVFITRMAVQHLVAVVGIMTDRYASGGGGTGTGILLLLEQDATPPAAITFLNI